MQEEARYEFLQAIREYTPEPLNHLWHEIYPEYHRWRHATLEASEQNRRWQASAEGQQYLEKLVCIYMRRGLTEKAAWIQARGRPPIDQDDAAFSCFMVFEVANPELARCLKNWAEQYGLTHLNSIPEEEPLTDLRSLDESFELAEIPFNPNYWACDWALSTLFFWDLLPVDDPRRSSSPPEWCPLLIDSPRAPEKTFTITATGWNSVLETETEYRKRIRGHLDNAITEYVRGVKKYLKPSGFTLRSCHTSDHVVWLALYQVLARPLAKVLEFERQTTPPLNETLFARA